MGLALRGRLRARVEGRARSTARVRMIYGLDTAPLPDGYTPLEAECVLKCLDDEGHVTLVTRGTNGLMIWDSIGMLTCAVEQCKARAVRAFEPDEHQDEDREEPDS